MEKKWTNWYCFEKVCFSGFKIQGKFNKFPWLLALISLYPLKFEKWDSSPLTSTFLQLSHSVKFFTDMSNINKIWCMVVLMVEKCHFTYAYCWQIKLEVNKKNLIMQFLTLHKINKLTLYFLSLLKGKMIYLFYKNRQTPYFIDIWQSLLKN